MSELSDVIDTTRRVARRGAQTSANLALRDAHVEAVARELFITLGYAGATIEEISRRASVAKRTLYKSYGGKAGLFALVIRSTADPEPMWLRVTTADSAEDALNAVAASILVGPAAQRGIDLMRLIIAEAPSQSELARETHLNGRIGALKSITKVFERLIQRGLLPACDPAVAAETFADTVIGSMLLLRLACYESDLEQRIAARVRHFIRTLDRL